MKEEGRTNVGDSESPLPLPPPIIIGGSVSPLFPLPPPPHPAARLVSFPLFVGSTVGFAAGESLCSLLLAISKKEKLLLLAFRADFKYI